MKDGLIDRRSFVEAIKKCPTILPWVKTLVEAIADDQPMAQYDVETLTGGLFVYRTDNGLTPPVSFIREHLYRMIVDKLAESGFVSVRKIEHPEMKAVEHRVSLLVLRPKIDGEVSR